MYVLFKSSFPPNIVTEDQDKTDKNCSLHVLLHIIY